MAPSESDADKSAKETERKRAYRLRKKQEAEKRAEQKKSHQAQRAVANRTYYRNKKLREGRMEPPPPIEMSPGTPPRIEMSSGTPPPVETPASQRPSSYIGQRQLTEPPMTPMGLLSSARMEGHKADDKDRGAFLDMVNSQTKAFESFIQQRKDKETHFYDVCKHIASSTPNAEGRRHHSSLFLENNLPPETSASNRSGMYKTTGLVEE